MIMYPFQSQYINASLFCQAFAARIRGIAKITDLFLAVLPVGHLSSCDKRDSEIFVVSSFGFMLFIAGESCRA